MQASPCPRWSPGGYQPGEPLNRARPPRARGRLVRRVALSDRYTLEDSRPDEQVDADQAARLADVLLEAVVSPDHPGWRPRRIGPSEVKG